jgi:acetyl-CoA C-acetyltransferase
VAPDDIAYYDVYSCFPSAVQAATEAIGLDESRRLTVTGGLTFAGGPLNNYVSHSIASMVALLREDPSALGLVTANGGFLTKHALGIYSATPPARPFARHSLAEGDVAHDARAAAPDATGALAVEACTVMHDRNGPTHTLFALLTPDGRRTWGRSDDAAVATAAMTDDLVGSSVHLDDKGVVAL